MAIDFGRKISGAFETGKLLFMSKEKSDEYFRKQMSELDDQHYRTGARDSIGRRTAMINRITTPLKKANSMGFVFRIAEKGGGYQPDTSTPLAFIPTYDNGLTLYVDTTPVFDLKFVSQSAGQIPQLKSGTFRGRQAEQCLARLTNTEWDGMTTDLLRGVMNDLSFGEMSVLMTKTGTPLLQQIEMMSKADQTQTMDKATFKYQAPPSAADHVAGMSDDDLEKMFKAMNPDGTHKETTSFDDFDY